MHISTMLVFWSLFSLVRNSVVLAVYLLFSIACFFTVHEHPLLDFIEEQGWQDLQMCEAVSLWDVIGTLPKGAGNGTATKTKKPSSTRKYVCPCCHQSVRATKAVNILCGDCMEKMEPSE